MSGFESIIASCICSSITIIEELIELRARMKTNDPRALDDLLQFMRNYDKYNKKEKKLIRKTLEMFLEQNISLNNSACTINPAQ